MQRSTILSRCLLGFLFAAASAHADLPPPNACTGAGTACDTAGPDHNQPGKCVATQCTRASASGPMQYDCTLCELDSSDGGGDASPSGEKKKDDGGCTVTRPGVPSRTAGPVVAALALGALVTRRRRR